MTRVLLKLSGEALSGNNDVTFDESTLLGITDSIRNINENNEVMLVVGGGNIFRGDELSSKLNIDRSTADYIGMLATIQNALVIRDYFIAHNLDSVVVSAIQMPTICEDYIPENVNQHLIDGKIVIFAAGLGAPFFTTDTTAVQRALELSAEEVIYVKNGVDGLYSGDPNREESVEKINEISATEVLEKDLKALDQTAVALARDNGLVLRIIGMTDLISAMDHNIGSIINPI